MKVEAQPSDREVLAGLVERVTYQNADNGFCVVRVKARGRRDLVTLVGHAATISAGQWITATGGWVNDRTHGQQFRAQFLRSVGCGRGGLLSLEKADEKCSSCGPHSNLERGGVRSQT
jgi:hypothetical protein